MTPRLREVLMPGEEGDVATAKQGVVREIHLLTTDVLLSELVNGGEVSLGEKRLGIASSD